MRKVQFTEHKIIAVLKSVETGRAVRCPLPLKWNSYN